MYDWIFAGEFLFARARLDDYSAPIDSEMTTSAPHSRPRPPQPRCASSALRLSCFDLEWQLAVSFSLIRQLQAWLGYLPSPKVLFVAYWFDHRLTNCSRFVRKSRGHRVIVAFETIPVTNEGPNERVSLQKWFPIVAVRPVMQLVVQPRLVDRWEFESQRAKCLRDSDRSNRRLWTFGSVLRRTYDPIASLGLAAHYRPHSLTTSGEPVDWSGWRQAMDDYRNWRELRDGDADDYYLTSNRFDDHLLVNFVLPVQPRQWFFSSRHAALSSPSNMKATS